MLYTTQAGGKLNSILWEKIIKKYKSKGIKFFSMYGSSEASARMSYVPWIS